MTEASEAVERLEKMAEWLIDTSLMGNLSAPPSGSSEVAADIRTILAQLAEAVERQGELALEADAAQVVRQNANARAEAAEAKLTELVNMLVPYRRPHGYVVTGTADLDLALESALSLPLEAKGSGADEKPDHFYDRDDWECTHGDLSSQEDTWLCNKGVGDIVSLGRLKELPGHFGVLAVEGDEEDFGTTIIYFDTFDKAKSFRDAMMAPTALNAREEG